MTTEMSMLALSGLPDIVPGDDLGSLLLEALAAQEFVIADGDIVVVAQKVVSKAAGRYVRLADVEPGAESALPDIS